jgi:hypothetical protein
VAFAPEDGEVTLDDGEVTPDGDMLGEALELGVVTLGVATLGVVTLAAPAVSLLVAGVAGVAGIAGLAGVADGSLTLPFEVVVVVRFDVSVGESLSGVFLDVSLCVVRDCPVLGWLVVTCAAAGIANAASITAASVYRCVIVSASPACWGRPPVLRRIHPCPADTVHVLRRIVIFPSENFEQ